MNVKTLFAAAFLVLATSAAHAQVRYQMGFTFGSNYSSLRSDLFTTSSGRLGIAAGCSFVLGFGDHFELNPEIIFTQKGASAKAVYFLPEQKADVQSYQYYYNTFEAGLFAGFQPVADVPFRIQAGGFFGTHFHNLDRDNFEVFVGDYDDINNATRAVDLNDAFSGVDFGPAFGLSAGEGRFRANIRYYIGRRNMYNQLEFVEEGHRIRSTALRLTLSYFLQ
ncbi:MAG: outer membrane beta-barrel protein [Lewinellaceae bacterium]|nr:outer membrane beta-barrel protein [Saprospiraceae bacterium]MCB0544089.1 outer membrane beta-barrel protein [Saprospiraceae bacterium]MCB9305742.1 outer membrane beta-barrel protein [Lewinellaceae bacterium]MCB9354014.1 outer membrane beta-barrel protein [Lewinellaceae bacterium]